jgi:hypothetical protein
MKKFALLALAILLVPNLVNAQCTVNGVDLWWSSNPLYQLGEGNIPIFAGQTLTWNKCEAGGTILFCFNVPTSPYLENCGALLFDSEEGWVYGEDFATENQICWELEDVYPDEGGTCYCWYFEVTADPLAAIGTINEVLLVATYCNDVSGELDIACATDTMTVYFEVVIPPPELELFCNELAEVDQGVASAYIGFEFCNGDPIADPRDYDWRATSLGTVGPAINQSGTLEGVPGGECDYVYAILDASAADIDDVDEVTMIGFFKFQGMGGLYDTCVTSILIVESVEVPLFTRPVVTIMVLAMILAAAVVMRRRATSVA